MPGRADATLSAAREERARAQAMSESAAARIEELRVRIHDEIEAVPEELAERAEIKDDEELPPLEQAEKRVEKLKQEREQLGGVNLRAEEEAAEQEARLATLVADRDDLTGAIERLRRGIQSLNREGRERLIESFEKVNRNFQELFTKLFEGGEAKLIFTESEDPLEAGLEIYARPPGKRLQSLALLSGGEQALTAMALIFAVSPGQSGAGLRAGRSGRTAGRRQCRAFLQDARPDGADVRHPLPGHHPPRPHYEPHGPAVRGDYGRARRQPACLGIPGRCREDRGGVILGQSRGRFAAPGISAGKPATWGQSVFLDTPKSQPYGPPAFASREGRFSRLFHGR